MWQIPGDQIISRMTCSELPENTHFNAADTEEIIWKRHKLRCLQGTTRKNILQVAERPLQAEYSPVENGLYSILQQEDN